MSIELIDIAPKRKFKYRCNYCHKPIYGKPVFKNTGNPSWHVFCSKKHSNMKVW